MKEKLLAILAKAKDLGMKAYVASPFLVGIAVGYFGKPIIKVAVEVGAKVIKWAFSL